VLTTSGANNEGIDLVVVTHLQSIL